VDYRRGQRWEYATRQEDQGSTLTILRVEDIPGEGPVAFIAVDGLNVRDARALSGIRTEIRFTELTADSLDRSVTVLRDEVEPPAHQDPYDGWRRAFDAGNATVFHDSVAEIVARFQRVCDDANRKRGAAG
jgi:hypothetical protein